MKRLAWLAAVMGMAAVCCPVGARAGGPSLGVSTAGAPVVVSLHGSIVVFAPDRSARTVVTRSGADFAPVVAPNGRAIAFWRSSPSSGREPLLRTVIIARKSRGGGWHVTPFSRRPAAAAGWQSTLAWAPGGNALAWFDRDTVQYRHVGRPQRRVMSTDSKHTTFVGLSFSRDGSTLASSLSPAGPNFPRTLRVVVRRLSAPRQRIITITFRPGVLAVPGKRGSFPVGDGLTCTTSQLAPLGHTLEFRAQIAGAGLQMTGIFLAPDTGGRARLVMGNGHGLHGTPPFGYGLAGATHFQEASNGGYIATDPAGGFYVAGQIGPLHVSAPVPRGCALSEWTWLADSTHLAYVTMCTVAGSTPIRYRLTLSAVSIFGGTPVTLLHTEAADPTGLFLAPTYRCVACG